MIAKLISSLLCLIFVLQFPSTDGLSRFSRSRLHVRPTLINQSETFSLYDKLYNKYNYNKAQFLELTGMAVANAIVYVYKFQPRVLVCCGPGDNGGQGLVCARHLQLFGFDVQIWYPSGPTEPIYKEFLRQCTAVGVNVTEKLPVNQKFKAIVDAIYGHEFKPPVDKKYVPALEFFKKAKSCVVSIDVPSGWDIDKGPTEFTFQPHTLVSILVPKQCSRFFKGQYHIVGGRFLPPVLECEYNFTLPVYPGAHNFVIMPSHHYPPSPDDLPKTEY